jgi:hypothetical protein
MFLKLHTAPSLVRVREDHRCLCPGLSLGYRRREPRSISFRPTILRTDTTEPIESQPRSAIWSDCLPRSDMPAEFSELLGNRLAAAWGPPGPADHVSGGSQPGIHSMFSLTRSTGYLKTLGALQRVQETPNHSSIPYQNPSTAFHLLGSQIPPTLLRSHHIRSLVSSFKSGGVRATCITHDLHT